MIRYVGLLVCLAVSTMAHAYNETITAVAYNPSRLGAYDYLKVNDITLKSGLRALGNTTEINLFGNVSILDANSNSNNHKNTADTNSLNTITNIKPLSNYEVDTDHHTFCTTGQSWAHNAKACNGTIHITAETLMGIGEHNFNYTGNTNLSDPNLIPNVYIYGNSGTSEIVKISSTDKYSRIKNIKRMYISGSTLQEENALPTQLSLQTKDLIKESEKGNLNITDTIAFGNVVIPASAFNVCTNHTYAWVERITDNHRKVKILACK